MQKKIERILKKYTKHKFVKLTPRGNKAILYAMRLARKVNPKRRFLTVDEGGWITYLQYPLKLKFDMDLIMTDYGVIDLADLRLKLKEKDCSALIYSNPAGYYAEQPIKEIFDVCKEHGCLVILDVTGSVGTELCDGRYADIIIGSFGDRKPVNAGKGGFISINDNHEVFEEIVSDVQFTKEELELIFEKLKNVPKRYKLFENICKRIKKDLKGYEILHKDKKGVNVIVRFRNEDEKTRILMYCERNKLQYTICPRYIRVKTDAVSIEVKRE